MKYSVKLTREDGKTVTLAANEYIDIDITEGNRRIFTLTLRNGKLYDQHDNEIEHLHDWDAHGKCTDCGQWNYYGTPTK